MAEHVWEIVLTIIGLLLTAVGTLIAWNLQSIKDKLVKVTEHQDDQDARIEDIQKSQLACKQHCQQEFVTVDQFVRNESYTRQKLDLIAENVNRLAGSMKIIEQMPALCGQIASNIVKEMKG